MPANTYFHDLIVHAAFDLWYKEQPHYWLSCKKGLYSVELLAEGEVRLVLDRTSITLKAPTVFWIGDDYRAFHYYYLSSQPYRHLWVDFSGDRGKRIYQSLRRDFPAGQLHLPQNRLPALLSIYSDILRTFHQPGGYNNNSMVLLLEKLMFQIHHSACRNLHYQGDPHFLSEVYHHIRHEPFQDYDIADLAASLGISQVYFRKLFKEYYHFPVCEFIFRVRMDSAAEKLLSGSYRISELADLCKFTTTSAFTKAFVRYFGLSPREYLRRAKTEPSPFRKDS